MYFSTLHHTVNLCRLLRALVLMCKWTRLGTEDSLRFSTHVHGAVLLRHSASLFLSHLKVFLATRDGPTWLGSGGGKRKRDWASGGRPEKKRGKEERGTYSPSFPTFSFPFSHGRQGVEGENKAKDKKQFEKWEKLSERVLCGMTQPTATEVNGRMFVHPKLLQGKKRRVYLRGLLSK